MTAAPHVLNATFNQTVAPGAKSTYTLVNEMEVIQKTPLADGGTLVRHYNFKSDHNSVDAFLVRDGQTSTYLGTKDIHKMEVSNCEAKAIGNALTRSSARMAL